MEYLHPSQMTPAQRRETMAGVFEKFAELHDRAADQTQSDHQRACAASARRRADRIRRLSDAEVQR